MIYIGMDVHQKSTTFCLFDPSAEKGRQYRTVTRPTTVEAIRAVLQPELSDALFFVAKGDGSHHFSSTLQEHERAVTRYQRRRKANGRRP